MDAQADPSLCWAYTHSVGFVMLRLKCLYCIHDHCFEKRPERLNKNVHVNDV